MFGCVPQRSIVRQGLLLLLALTLVPCLLAQVGSLEPAANTHAQLLDEFGPVSECDLGARIDNMMASLAKQPDGQGYIINYLGADTLPGERDKYTRERIIANQIAFRGFDPARITLVRGGFRETVTTELWLVPPGAEPPTPSKTLPGPKLPNSKTFLFAKTYFESNDVDDPLDEFVLAAVKEREKAENEAWLEENKSEDVSNGVPESEQSDDSQVARQAEDEQIDIEEEPTAEQKEEERFQWANVGIARLLTERRHDMGVIIFYADDLRYDIRQLRNFIIKGRNLLAEHGSIKSSRLRIEFGGYRDNPGVEFWVVPPKGRRPVATPDARPVEEAETDQN